MKWNQVTIKNIIRLTPDAVQLNLKAIENCPEFQNFQSGQFINVRTTIDNEEVRRSYSICSCPGADSFSIGIKQIEGGLFSTFANQQLKIGDKLEVSFPDGKFVNDLEKADDKNFVFIASGSGITPILSLIQSALLQSETSQVSLFYGNKSVRSIMFLETIEALKNIYLDRFQVYHILSQQQQDSDLFNGRIDGDKIESWNKLLFDVDEVDAFFLCGPEGMISSASKKLQTLGVDSSAIKFELFTSKEAEKAREKRRATETTSKKSKHKVKVQVHGRQLAFGFDQSDDNILDASLANGADLPYACKGGVCCTCKARLKEGEVKMYVNYGLEPDEIEQGFILTCQAYPTTESIEVDFDDV